MTLVRSKYTAAVKPREPFERPGAAANAARSIRSKQLVPNEPLNFQHWQESLRKPLELRQRTKPVAVASSEFRGAAKSVRNDAVSARASQREPATPHAPAPDLILEPGDERRSRRGDQPLVDSDPASAPPPQVNAAMAPSVAVAAFGANSVPPSAAAGATALQRPKPTKPPKTPKMVKALSRTPASQHAGAALRSQQQVSPNVQEIARPALGPDTPLSRSAPALPSSTPVAAHLPSRATHEPKSSSPGRAALRAFWRETKDIAAVGWKAGRTAVRAVMLPLRVAELMAVVVIHAVHAPATWLYNRGAARWGYEPTLGTLSPAVGICAQRVEKSWTAVCSGLDALSMVIGIDGPVHQRENLTQAAMAGLPDDKAPANTSRAAAQMPLAAAGAITDDIAARPLSQLAHARAKMQDQVKAAQLTAARDKVASRAIALGALVSVGVLACMALTVVAPPLAIVAAVATWYVGKNAWANLKTSHTNLELLRQGKPALPVGHSAVGNAVHRRLKKQADNLAAATTPEAAEAMRGKAAAVALHVARIAAVANLAIGLASGCAAKLAQVGVFAMRRGLQAGGLMVTWVSDTFSGHRDQRAKAAPLEQLNSAVKQALTGTGTRCDVAALAPELIAELALWRISLAELQTHAANLNSWTDAGSKKGKEPLLYPAVSSVGQKLALASRHSNYGVVASIAGQVIIYSLRAAVGLQTR